MLEEEKIVEIIQRKLEGNLSSEETSLLNKWLEIPENAASYAQYEQIWAGTASLATKKDHFTSNSSSSSWEAIEQHILVDKPRRSFKIAYGVAASIGLILLFLGANYIFNTGNSNDTIQYVLQANENDTLTFDDGSQAYLFGPCSISYPKEFAANERVISMDGFVYFDIAHDKTRLFEINTENGKVEVLGTSFTVDTRQDKTFIVQCITGKVRMTASENGTERKTILTRNTKGTYKTLSKELNITSFENKDLNIKIPVRNMTFNNKPLGEILERIEYDYGVTIQLENKNLLDMKYSTSLNDTTIDDFLNELKITFKVEVIQTKPSTYTLKGGALN